MEGAGTNQDPRISIYIYRYLYPNQSISISLYIQHASDVWLISGLLATGNLPTNLPRRAASAAKFVHPLLKIHPQQLQCLSLRLHLRGFSSHSSPWWKTRGISKTLKQPWNMIENYLESVQRKRNLWPSLCTMAITCHNPTSWFHMAKHRYPAGLFSCLAHISYVHTFSYRNVKKGRIRQR